jgi:nitrogenase molybdenum-iron protein alpha/beta subunit
LKIDRSVQIFCKNQILLKVNILLFQEYSGPYHGYDGFAIFARDMDLALNSPTWGLIGAPWNQKTKTKATAKATA